MFKHIFFIIFSVVLLVACSDDVNQPTLIIDPVESLITVDGVAPSQVGDSTLIVKLPYASDKKKLTLCCQSDGRLSIDGVKLGKETQVDLSRPLTLTVTSPDGKTKDFTIAVCYSGIPVVYIDTPQPIESKEKWVKDCHITIVTDSTDVQSLESVQLKGRGNTTWSYPKKPYAIKLDSKTEILGMPKHKRWVLLANYLDKTLMRNAVAFEIGRAMADGLGWTPRGRFVDVVFNGTHVGNYYLCEQIKVDKNRVDITEMKAGDTTGDAVTGGYLLEYDTYFDEVNKFRSELRGLPVNIKEPDEDVLSPAQLQYIRDFINNVESTLSGNFELEKLSGLINIDSFIDWWLANELIQNYEPNHPKSCYMHKDRNGLLTAGPMWDYDYGTLASQAKEWLLSKSLYYGELFANPDFVTRVKERWQLHKAALQAIPDFIDATFAEIQPSATANQALWTTPDYPNAEGALSYEEAVSRLRLLYKLRLSWMDAQIQKM